MLDKAVSVLDALQAAPRSLAELVVATGLSRATAHRLAVALEVHGLAGRDLDGRFVLGPRLVALGEAAVGALPLADVALGALAELRDATGESVQLYVRQGERRTCVAALESPHGLRTIVPTGASFPLSVGGSAARALAGEASSSVAGDAGDAWVQSVEEREPGVASVSAPIYDAEGAPIAAVGVSGPVERTSREPGPRYGPAVAQAARAIERAAGLSGPEPGGARR